MEKRKRWFSVLIGLVLFLVFGRLLMIYSHPMEDIFLDLSVAPQEDGLYMDPEQFDSKGWSVYTADGQTRTELIPNGYGGYSGLELGQTFYYSRVLEENLDSPTLQIAAVEQTFAVWLDDVLLYTDLPDLDNRIGCLTLPMNDWLRGDSITISLPADYQGKTLTIAQSFPDWAETSRITAYPTAVTLYCGYAYESSLISESYNTAIQCALVFLIGVFLMIAFIRSGDWGFICLTFVALCAMAERLIGTSFYYQYFGGNSNHFSSVVPLVSCLAVLVFLTLRAPNRKRFLQGTVFVAALSIAVNGICQLLFMGFDNTQTVRNWFILHFPYWCAMLSLSVVLVQSWRDWKNSSWYYRIFTPTATLFVIVYWILSALVFQKGYFLQQILSGFANIQIQYLYSHTAPAIILAAVIAAVVEAAKNEMNHLAEQHLVALKSELAMSSYENLNRQHEEVMMLRHDMTRHLHTIQEMSTEPQIQKYLSDLIGQNEKIRPVVQSGNEMLDILLNSKLSVAADLGIRTDIHQVHVPDVIPLSDADLCSLIINLMDNAIDAASKTSAPFLFLDIHTRDGYLAIVCENSYDPVLSTQAKKETVPTHGLGMKIIRNITQRYEGVFIADKDEGCYKCKIVIPLT